MGIRLAVIPAAGAGTRLDRLGTPKPIVEVAGVPIVIRLLTQLSAAGVERAIIVLGADSEAVRAALTADGRVPLPLEFVVAPRWREGLAASLLAAADHVDEPFLLAMADHLFDDRLIQRMASQRVVDDEVAALVDSDTASIFDLAGAVKVAFDRDRIRAIGELAGFDGVDAGLFAAGPALFVALRVAVEIGACALADALMPLARAGSLRAVSVDGLRWDDIDTPAALVHAELRLRREHRQVVRRVAQHEGDSRDHDYRFLTSSPATTDVVIRRAGATGAQVDLGIPEESAASPIFVLTDQTVNGLYGDRFVSALESSGYDVRRVVMPDGEKAKTLENFTALVETVLAHGIDEHSVMISLGGGVVCNVSGFAAATLYRGIGLIHVPTTLMAQCDAAISHKQALNGTRGKNLVGAYYAPQRIVIDIDFLQTLSERQLRDGLSEALKHALAQDPAYLAWFLAQPGDLRDPVFLEYVVRHNIELKCTLMAEDPKEKSRGLVLQYAHNVAHAIEHLSGYELTHGESVSIGMVVAANVSRLLGGCDEALVDTHRHVLGAYGLPCEVPAEMRTSDILAAVRYDKKTLAEGMRMPLLSGVGRLWSVDHEYAIPVANAVLARALEASRAS